MSLFLCKVTESALFPETNTTFVMVRFFQDDVDEELSSRTLLETVGASASFADHAGLRYMTQGGIQRLVCLRPAPRVILTTFFREPLARYLASFEAATASVDAPPCADRTPTWYRDMHLRYFDARSASKRFLLAYRPYSMVFQITDDATIKAAEIRLQQDFIVGIDKNIDAYFSLLTKVFRLDDRASKAYGDRQAFLVQRRRRDNKGGCFSSASLPKAVVDDLSTLIKTDFTIYDIATKVHQKQMLLEPQQLPAHSTFFWSRNRCRHRRHSPLAV